MKYLAVIILLPVIFSCKKKLPEQAIEPSSKLTRGLPADKQTIHGYISVSYSMTNQYSHNYKLYAAFADPGRDLLNAYNAITGDVFNNNTCGIVDAGLIRYNQYTAMAPANTGASVKYVKTITLPSPQDSAQWKVEGNGSFAKINETFYKPYSTFIDFPQSKRKISLSNRYTFYIDSLFTDYDMVTVFIDDDYNPHYGIKKTSQGAPLVFTAAELSSINAANNFYYRIYFGASRFYYKIIQGKTFVFEFNYQISFIANLLP